MDGIVHSVGALLLPLNTLSPVMLSSVRINRLPINNYSVLFLNYYPVLLIGPILMFMGSVAVREYDVVSRGRYIGLVDGGHCFSKYPALVHAGEYNHGN